MASSKCAFNTATALRRVFIPSSLGTTDCLHVTRIFVPALLPAATQQIRAATWDRSFGGAGTWGANNTRAAPAKRGPAAFDRPPQMSPLPRRPKKNASAPRVVAKLGRLPRDDEIRPPFVHLKELSSDGREMLSEPQRVKELLQEIDTKTHSLQVIHMPDLEDPNPSALKWPIAVIINKKEELQRQQHEKEQRKKQAATNKEKELEINWSMTQHDLEHKVKNMQRFLAKGYKVQVLFQKKRKAKVQSTEKEAQALVDRVVEGTLEVPGAKEWKGREGKLLNTLKLFLQGKAQEAPSGASIDE
ncbi:hypothetical protein BD289DRAFT_423269 [Coniella lustricola]|uniref:Translation initiation factor IF-3, C-terminal domain-domain-containing protein n=1 Tax=Coniella lustricola TaxID=2025994 RepID=A0A2T3AJV6_9PEZI|nr:hypothetical protein BD289DRAFT_423269 [Coniella lustricola]